MGLCAAISPHEIPILSIRPWLLPHQGLLHCTGMEKLEDLPPDLLRHAFAVADKDKQLELHQSGSPSQWCCFLAGRCRSFLHFLYVTGNVIHLTNVLGVHQPPVFPQKLLLWRWIWNLEIPVWLAESYLGKDRGVLSNPIHESV